MKIHFIDEFPKIKPQYIVFSKFWLFVFCIKPVDNLWISRQIAYFWKKIQKHDHNILCLLNFGYLCSVDNLNSYPQVIHRLSTGFLQGFLLIFPKKLKIPESSILIEKRENNNIRFCFEIKRWKI